MAYKVSANCLKFSLLIAFLLFLQPAFSQYDFSEVDQLLNANQKMMGGHIVTLVYKDGKMVYKKEIGEDFTQKTQAPIASCSKWLTAALVMTFVDKGELSLDDPVSKYLPVFTSYSKGYITIRNCLSHTTGIQADLPGLKAFLQRRKYHTLEDEVNAFASKREIEHNPGEAFYYSGIGLNIAGRVLEVISKKTFDRLIQERILRPLKMRNTTFYLDYDKAVNPSGGGYSSAADYMNFLAMILNKGLFEGKRILSEEAIREMQKMQTGRAVIKYVPQVAEGFDYGLGEWILAKDSKGDATVVSSPGLFGTFPYVDICRGYACIFFVKTLLNEQKKDFYLTLKEVIDKQLTGNCQ
jgi:CubicO group peptidase (beta-lactamase class C family)